MRGFRRMAVLLGAPAVLGGAPVTAGAEVFCDYAQSGKFLEVRITKSFDLAEISVSRPG